jgi:hypothetical protein
MNMTAAKRRPAQRRVENRNFLTALDQLHDQSAFCRSATTVEPTVDKRGQAAKGDTSDSPDVEVHHFGGAEPHPLVRPYLIHTGSGRFLASGPRRQAPFSP